MTRPAPSSSVSSELALKNARELAGLLGERWTVSSAAPV
jgi:hypothetical protein